MGSSFFTSQKLHGLYKGENKMITILSIIVIGIVMGYCFNKLYSSMFNTKDWETLVKNQKS